MTLGAGFRWFRILQERDRRRIRRGVIVGVYLPILAGIIIVGTITIFTHAGAPPAAVEPELGGMSGGGGGDDKDYEMEFGSTAGDNSTVDESSVKSVEIQLLQIRIISPEAAVAKPVVKPDTKQQLQKKHQVASVAGPPPVRRLRGVGPGAGGGTGGGSGGGIGAGVGFSIDWGGTGSRRLLSGRLPKYPPGTDAEMAIAVTFTVLADGTVSSVVPTKRGNDVLEREAVSAIRTWRFESLPPAIGEKVQSGSVVFNFKLDKSNTVRQ